ncbi:MAG: phytanoyl-CoA dioxygenase family protein [Proteobacteria bacterium]|nr:phytanoyl-CoA dioxygenase family protein [Pseudomonadota bacterium]
MLPRSTTDLDRAEDDLFEHGYCIVADVLTPGEVAALKARLQDQARAERERAIAYEFGEVVREAGTENFTVTVQPGDDRPRHQFVGVLINKGAIFRDLVLHPVADRLAAALLGEDWVLSSLDSSIVRPGGPMQALHTDQWWMPRPQQRNSRQRPAGAIRRGEFYGADEGAPDRLIAPAVSCTAAWTLTEFRADNGATRVVPGSHLSGEQPDPARDYDNEAVSIEAPAGSFILWDARLWHGMGKNRAADERVGLYTVYNAPMFRSQINFQLALLPEVKAACSPALLARLGWKIWGGYYGRVGAADGDLAREEDIIPELP